MTKKKKPHNIRKRINKNMNLSTKFMFGDDELKKMTKKKRK